MRVVHRCAKSLEVVFDEYVTDDNRNDDQLWKRECDHPHGLTSIFLYRGEAIPKLADKLRDKAQKKKAKRKRRTQQLGELKNETALVTWKLKESSHKLLHHKINYLPFEHPKNENKSNTNAPTRKRIVDKMVQQKWTLNTNFHMMPVNDTLQLQVLPEADRKTTKLRDDNPRGYNIYADRSIYLTPGKSNIYYNLSLSLTPPIDTRMVVLKGEGPEHENWKLYGNHLGIDSTGEAMLALANKRETGTLIKEGTLLAQLIIEPITKTATNNDDDDPANDAEQTHETWCEGCRCIMCTVTKCKECMTTLCYTCWKDHRSSPASMSVDQAEKWIGCKMCASDWNTPQFLMDYEVTKGVMDERKRWDSAVTDHEAKRKDSARIEESIIRAQNSALKNTNASMIVTIEDPDDDMHGKRRVIRINGVRFYKRDRHKNPEHDLQWFDPTFISRKPWYFSIPVIAFGKCVVNSENASEDIPKVIRDQIIQHNRPFKVRSIEKAMCLTKLASFADGVGIKMIEDIEDTKEIRRRTDARIATIDCDKHNGKWLDFMGSAYCQAFAQMFDEQGITGIGGWSSKPRKIVVIDKRTTYQGDIVEKEISTSLNIIGRAIQKALKLTEFCTKEAYAEDEDDDNEIPLLNYRWRAKDDYTLGTVDVTSQTATDTRNSEALQLIDEQNTSSDEGEDPEIVNKTIAGTPIDINTNIKQLQRRSELLAASKEADNDTHNRQNALSATLTTIGPLGATTQILNTILEELDEKVLRYEEQCDDTQKCFDEIPHYGDDNDHERTFNEWAKNVQKQTAEISDHIQSLASSKEQRTKLYDRAISIAMIAIETEKDSLETEKRGYKSTVDSRNRRRDKAMIEERLGLPEQGSESLELFSLFDEELKIATGYQRIVYGDHGPYFEFSKEQILWENFPKSRKKSAAAYYDEAYTDDYKLMLYVQKKTVKDRPNPPRGRFSCRNFRAEGYADYLPGMYYLSATTVMRPSSKVIRATVAVAEPTRHRLKFNALVRTDKRLRKRPDEKRSPMHVMTKILIAKNVHYSSDYITWVKKNGKKANKRSTTTKSYCH